MTRCRKLRDKELRNFDSSHCLGEKITDYETGGACCILRGYEKMNTKFQPQNFRERDHLQDLSVDRNILVNELVNLSQETVSK